VNSSFILRADYLNYKTINATRIDKCYKTEFKNYLMSKSSSSLFNLIYPENNSCFIVNRFLNSKVSSNIETRGDYSWSGTGEGEPGKGNYERTYQFVLNKRFIQVNNKSTYPPSEANKNKGEIHEDAGVLGNKTGLIDGMNVTAVISLNQATVPAVPTDVIITLEGKDYIFVQTTEEIKGGQASKEQPEPKEKEIAFERIPVAKGTSDVGYTEITLLKEIPKGAEIVVKGAFFVSAKMTNTRRNK
jgi:hypothetical protein